MGELVVGKPALQLNYAVSLPLDLVSVLSLLYRAVPGSGLNPWLVGGRRALSEELRADLDLLHGFSGRMLYYMEEPVMAFQPLRPDRIDATFDELASFLESFSPDDYLGMVGKALERVHRDLGTGRKAPRDNDELAWRSFIEPGLTTAAIDDVLRLVNHPDELRARTIGLYTGIWNEGYAQEFAAHQQDLQDAAAIASQTSIRGFAMAFTELTGNRLPSTLLSGLSDVEIVTFCPSYLVGSFVSYVLYPPNLVVFFGAPELLARQRPAVTATTSRTEPAATTGGSGSTAMGGDAVLDALRALGDPNRLQIVDLLSGGELYAQEIVGRLGIAQSAVSRHLSLLERAGLVKVRPRGGMKYYAVDCARLDALADALRNRGRS